MECVEGIQWPHFLLLSVWWILLYPHAFLSANSQCYPNPTTPVSNHLPGNTRESGKNAGLDISSLTLLLRAKITIWDLNLES